MICEILTSNPSENPALIEYKRSFLVEGTFNTKSIIPNDALLTINLYDKKNKLVRHVSCNQKNKPFMLYYPNFTTYKEELDPCHEKLKNFGFPPLIVDDIDNPYDSIKNATIKCWYNDTSFKAMIISATDVAHGAMLDDGMNFVDENGKPYELLQAGEYKIEITLKHNDDILGHACKNIIIGQKDTQVICRFNPKSNKERMITWCRENNISIVTDTLPGYLEPYLGEWYYHMGLLKMYRANDIAFFDSVKVKMFVYLIDVKSTSYETELAFLQKNNKINKDYFEAFYYDIGEPKVSGRNAVIKKFDENEIMHIARIDIVNNNAKENVFNLNEEGILRTFFDTDEIKLDADSQFAVMGIIKPWQMESDDFILQEDNTYKILNAPDCIEYIFDDGSSKETIRRKVGLERIDKKKIGGSVFEFYNILQVKKEYAGKKITLQISCIDKHGNKIKDCEQILIKVGF